MAIKEGKPALLKATTDVTRDSVITASVPPDVPFLPGCFAEPRPHATVRLLNPGPGFAATMKPRNLGDVDTEIHCEQAVPVFAEPRNAGHARWVRCPHLNVENLGE